MRKIIYEAKKNGVQFPKILSEYQVRQTKKDTREQQGSMEIPNIGSADDKSALTESVEDLQTLVKIMGDGFKELHLILNLYKTQTIVIKINTRTIFQGK